MEVSRPNYIDKRDIHTLPMLSKSEYRVSKICKIDGNDIDGYLILAKDVANNIKNVDIVYNDNLLYRSSFDYWADAESWFYSVMRSLRELEERDFISFLGKRFARLN